MSESKLQADCFQWHWDNYKHQRKLMYMNNNNPKNPIHGALLKAMGLIRGVSDLSYLVNGTIVFIEMKDKGKGQTDDQKQWQAIVEAAGYQYHVIDNFDDFKALIERLNS
jgi:hypothetical protein